jgi:hypothetical protein
LAPGLASQVVSVEPGRVESGSGAMHKIRTTSLESGPFYPTLFLRFLDFSNQLRTSFPEEKTISTVSTLFPHLLATMSLFLRM